VVAGAGEAGFDAAEEAAEEGHIHLMICGETRKPPMEGEEGKSNASRGRRKTGIAWYE
jgi:hypothetical protein